MMYRIEKHVVSPYETNRYFLISENETLIIDPGDNANLLLRKLQDKNPVGIVVTHCHSDHISAINELVEAYSIPVMVGQDDVAGVADPHLSGSDDDGTFYKVDVPCAGLREGEVIQWGDATLQVLSTPGHTPGSICLLDTENSIMFTGDTLFAGSVGRTDFVRGDAAAMRQTCKRLAGLDPALSVLPGHGPATTIEVEKRLNPFLSSFTH